MIKIFAIILLLIISFILIYNRFKQKKFKVGNNIPKVIYQTYISKDRIPKKVYENINKYGDGYKHIIYDDNECKKFLEENYEPKVLEKYLKLKRGAHRADLFRYCLLYKYGGIYLDIKTELIKPLNEIFTSNYLYSVFSLNGKKIYQGIIASPPNNPIFETLIDRVINTRDNIINSDYHIFTEQFYNICQESCKKVLIQGLNLNRKSNINMYFFQEINLDKKECNNLLDRYGLCCYVYDKKMKIIKTRYEDYPW